MMESPKQTCYVCDQEGKEELITELDGRVHVFFVHKRAKGAGRPRRCDAGYNETEAEFMEGLEKGDEEINAIKASKGIGKRYLKIAPGATTEVFVKMFMQTCQRCNNSWVTKKQFPKVCVKCTSPNWNME